MSQDTSYNYCLPPGTVLRSPHASYTVLRVLGVGGFGITYLVEGVYKFGNIPVKTNFAIKEHFISSKCSRRTNTQSIEFSAPVAATVEKSRKAFIKEACRVHDVGIDHTNIVKINEVFEANNTAYYVMEYLDGETLEQYVQRRGALPYQEADRIIRPIAEAVALLHNNRLAHYDIKPQNIILTLDEKKRIRPVLIDFGLAKHYDRQGDATSTTVISGYSEGFAPVEQYGVLENFTPQADVYALAASMLYCLTGETPLDARMFDIDKEAISIRALMPEKAADGLIHALQMKNWERTPDASHFVAETFYSSGVVVEETEPVPEDTSPTDQNDQNPVKPGAVTDPYDGPRVGVVPPEGDTIQRPTEPISVDNDKSTTNTSEKGPVTVIGAPQPTVPVDPSKKRKSKKYIIIATIFVIVCAVIIAFFIGFPDEATQETPDDSMDTTTVKPGTVEPEPEPPLPFTITDNRSESTTKSEDNKKTDSKNKSSSDPRRDNTKDNTFNKRYKVTPKKDTVSPNRYTVTLKSVPKKEKEEPSKNINKDLLLD